MTPAFSGVPNRRGPNQKWLHHPCLLGGRLFGEGGQKQAQVGKRQKRGPPRTRRANTPPLPGIKAEIVCRLVLPDVRACLPVEEGILHSWIGGLVVHPMGWGVKGAGAKLARGWESADDATVTMSPFWNSPTAGDCWRVAFCLPVGTHLCFRLGRGGGGGVASSNKEGDVFQNLGLAGSGWPCVMLCHHHLLWRVKMGGGIGCGGTT